MDRHQFARKGSRKHVGTAAEIGTGTANVKGAPWYGFKALADVTITSIKGAGLVDDNDTAGQLTSIDLAKGDEFFGGQIDRITVPSGKAILLFPL